MKYLVTNPLNYLFVFITLSVLIILLTKSKRRWRLALIPFGLILYYFLTPLGANKALSLITANNASTRIDHLSCSTQTAIVFFDHSENHPPAGSYDFSALSTEENRALVHASQWALDNIQRRVILAGSTLSGSDTTKPKIAARLTETIGLPQNRVIFAESNGTMLQHSKVAAELSSEQKLIVFTSDVKSRRANYALELAGKYACTSISSNSKISVHRLRSILPSPDSASLLEKVLWEFFGLLWYKLN